jgi:hypothetical protein
MTPTTETRHRTGSSDRLVRLVREHRERQPARVSLEPATAYEAITRQMVEDLVRELAALRTRFDAMFYLVVGSLVVDVMLRIIG